jgi:NAD+ diphosphatase
MGRMNYCPQCGRQLVRRQMDGAERACCDAEGCGFVAWDNPTPVVAALVEYDGKVLLARNAGWPEGMFSVITGFLEKDETPEQCAVREVAEELGLEGRIAGYIGHYAFTRKNQLILAFHVVAEGDIRLNEELLEFRLIDKHKLKPWRFGTGPAVIDWLRSQGIDPA